MRVDIHTGEIYGKQNSSKFVMYNVVKVSRNAVILQNIDNPLSLFETNGAKLQSAGYVRISQTPYVNMGTLPAKKRKAQKKPGRCPYTLDFIAERADCQRPPTPPTAI